MYCDQQANDYYESPKYASLLFNMKLCERTGKYRKANCQPFDRVGLPDQSTHLGASIKVCRFIASLSDSCRLILGILSCTCLLTMGIDFGDRFAITVGE